MEVGTSEAEPIWTEFLRRLARRGLRGVKLAVSDAIKGPRLPSPKFSVSPGSGAAFTS
jgi:transposase-like protein